MGELEANRENNRSQEDVHENWNRGLEVDVVGEEITIKGRIQEVEKLAAKICQDKIELNEDIEKRKCDRSSGLFRLEDLNEKGLKSRLAVEREKMNILQLFLLRLTNKAPQGKPEKPFMPREKISKHKMNFRMVHGTNSLADEKQLVKEMNMRRKEDTAGSFSPLGRDYYYYIPPPLVTTYYLRHLSAVQYLRNQRSIMHHRLRQIQELQWQGDRPGIVFERQWDEAIAEERASANPNAAANAIATARIWDSLSSKKALQEQIKVTGEKIEELTKSLTAVRPKVRKVERELKAIERDMEILEKKLPLIDQRKDEAYQCLLKLKNQQRSNTANPPKKTSDIAKQPLLVVCASRSVELKWKSARPGMLFEMQWDEATANEAGANTNAAANAKRIICDSFSSKKALKEQIKVSYTILTDQIEQVTGEKIEELTKSLSGVRPKVRKVERELKAIERDIKCLEQSTMEELEAKRDNNSLQEDLHDNWNRGLEVDAADDEKTDLKGRIHEVEKLAEKISQDRLELDEDIVKRTCDRACTLSRLESLKDREMGLGSLLSAAREKMNILQLFLLHSAEKAYQGKPMKPFLSADEIAKHKMNFRMGHGTNSLAEEKQLLKQMNVRQKEGVDSFSSLEGHCYTPPYVDTWHLPLDEFYYVKNQRSIVRNRLRHIQELKWKSARPGILFQRQWDEPNGYVGDNANAAANAIANPKRRIWDSLSLKKALQEQIKVSGQKVDEVTKSLLAVRPKIKKVERELKAIERDIECLKKNLTLMDHRKDEALPAFGNQEINRDFSGG
ncbi:uncharacterized protein [Pyrus communis]|uniref:uncharacterized protein n=1 Tax=Pyrus communis TaxID=23211 RepID=UPI0035C26D35